MKWKILAVLVAAVGGVCSAMLVSSASATHPTTTQSTGGGHTPVTICHKPGTPAEQELVVDDDSVELTGHLGHGDTIGPCPTMSTTTETETTTTGTTETQPTETIDTSPPPERCPPGMEPRKGKDGNPGNQECCFPGVDCDGDTPASPPGDTTTTPETTATTPTAPVPTTAEPSSPEPVSPSGDSGTPPPVKTSSGSNSKTTKPKPPPVCPPGKPYAGACAVQGSG